MSNCKLILFVPTILVMFLAANSVFASSVAVGDSTLIGTLDYSDTFTLEANGGLTGRVDGVALSGSALAVENNYANSPSTWHAAVGTAMTSTSAGIADSGAGSDTGIIKNTDGWPDYGFAYGVRDEFIVQYDAMLSSAGGRVDIGIGSTQGFGNATILEDGNLTVFFRCDDSPSFSPGVSLYDGGPNKEINVPITTGLSTTSDIGVWHNFAVGFDLTERTLDFYVDEGYRGSVDLDTIENASLQAFTLSNAFVNVGHNSNPMHMDNVQVGAVPEPGTLILLVGGLLFLAWRRLR